MTEKTIKISRYEMYSSTIKKIPIKPNQKYGIEMEIIGYEGDLTSGCIVATINELGSISKNIKRLAKNFSEKQKKKILSPITFSDDLSLIFLEPQKSIT